MSYFQGIEEVPYPPSPSTKTGKMWTGLFKSDVPRKLPNGLKHLLDPHLFIVSLIRYHDVALRYDEIFFGTLALMGMRCGIHFDDILVSDRASFLSKHWGLAKNLADFAWEGSTVQISDAQGLIAKISVDLRPARLPWMWMPSPGFGHLDESLVYFWGSLWARPDKAGMQIVEWPARFPALQSNKPAFSFGARPFKMQVWLPKILRIKEYK